MTSQTITRVPVPIVTTLATASGAWATSSSTITSPPPKTTSKRPSTRSRNADITDLILDLRYNGGGYLDMASELSYMVANTTLTVRPTFEKLVFNDKNPTRDPVTGEQLTPTPFHSTSQGFSGRGGPAASDAESRPHLHHRRTGHLFGQRVHHQRTARRERPGVHHRLDDLRQAVWLLSHGQLRDYLLLHPVPRRERR